MRLLLILLLLLSLPQQAYARLSGPPEAGQARSARDLPTIRSAGVLRVLVNQSRNSSGVVKGQAIGVEHLRLRAFEQFLNRNNTGPNKLTLKIIPMAKDQLLGALIRGEGDLVAPGELLPIRAGRNVIASKAFQRNVPLVLVSLKGNRHYRSFEQLAGRSLSLPAGSAVAAVLPTINERLSAQKLPPIISEWVDPSLAVEDVLEMVQAGIFDRTVVELPIAQRWARVMPKLRVDDHLVFARDDGIKWFVRPDSPILRANVDQFVGQYKPPADQNAAFERVYRRLYRIHSPFGRVERARLAKVRGVLEKHAKRIEVDWLLLAALAYKESTLNPRARGTSGPVGLMQITPTAARSVGVSKIHDLDSNVQAASNYLAMIRRRYFSSARFNERERLAFMLAGYNLGPDRVQSLRAEARRRGLNPNQWFFQVERVAMDQIGMGVVSYVNAVNKYHLAYQRERFGLEN